VAVFVNVGAKFDPFSAQSAEQKVFGHEICIHPKKSDKIMKNRIFLRIWPKSLKFWVQVWSFLPIFHNKLCTPPLFSNLRVHEGKST